MSSSFDNRANEWDLKSRRVQNAQNIASVIEDSICLNRDMTIMDLGAGTGLLSYFLSNKVGKVIAVDNSSKMLDVFMSKKDNFNCKIDSINADISKDSIDGKFDAIVSSMTIHHIEDTKELLKKLYALLESNGYLALADLEREDGSFHSDNSGVYHFGFDFNKLSNIAKDIGFKNIDIKSANSINKEDKEYKVAILIASK